MGISIDYLVPDLRLRIGDVDSSQYRYLDEWLVKSLIVSIKSLSRFWQSKYITTDGGYVTRNPDYIDFEFDEDEGGVIQDKDEYIIILKAASIVLTGSLENSAWNIGSWRDAEIAYSSIESGKLRSETLRAINAELAELLKSPMKILVIPRREQMLETDL